MSNNDDAVSQRAEELREKADLSERESQVVALKEQGLTHEEIAERLSEDSGFVGDTSVDEYSRRAGEKYRKAVNTVEALNSVYDEANNE